MRKQFVASILTLLVLAGCASGKQISDNMRKTLLGKHIDTAVKIYGYPDGSAKISDRIVYTWTHNQTDTDPRCGSKPGDFGPTFGCDNVQIRSSCKFQVFTDLREIIQSWTYDGDPRACTFFWSRFDY